MLAVALALLAAAPAEADADARGDDARPYDAHPRAYGGGETAERALDGNGGSAVAAIVPFFTDCAPGEVFAGCGPPPARWVVGDAPVEFCTFQNNRPDSISASVFREAVQDAADVWNAVEAAVGALYLGDCPSGFRWTEGNEVNEIGFDDERNAVSGTQAGITMGSWLNRPSSANVQSREFIEADIVLDEGLNVPLACFRSVIAHEMGHALGFGHSDTEGDLMFPSFAPSDLSTCPAAPSAEERSRLQELYGVDRLPSVSAGLDRVVDAAQEVTLLATGSDPEGKPLTYEWLQVAGPPVSLVQDGARATFTAPSDGITPFRFQVTARDPFLHRASATVQITVSSADAPPVVIPSLVSFLPNASRTAALVGWEVGDAATSFELCSHPTPLRTLESCGTVASPEVPITWDTVLGSAGRADATRVFDEPGRDTTLAACNTAGCTPPGFGPIVGGLRWDAWDIDFDYLTFAFDVRSVRWTFAAVANLSDEPRTFLFRTGPSEDPTRSRFHGCGVLRPGGVCIGWIAPNEGPHGEMVTIVSSDAGTPTTEHRFTVR